MDFSAQAQILFPSIYNIFTKKTIPPPTKSKQQFTKEEMEKEK